MKFITIHLKIITKSKNLMPKIMTFINEFVDNFYIKSIDGNKCMDQFSEKVHNFKNIFINLNPVKLKEIKIICS
jgi:hypothetical protein